MVKKVRYSNEENNMLIIDRVDTVNQISLLTNMENAKHYVFDLNTRNVIGKTPILSDAIMKGLVHEVYQGTPARFLSLLAFTVDAGKGILK